MYEGAVDSWVEAGMIDRKRAVVAWMRTYLWWNL